MYNLLLLFVGACLAGSLALIKGEMNFVVLAASALMSIAIRLSIELVEYDKIGAQKKHSNL